MPVVRPDISWHSGSSCPLRGNDDLESAERDNTDTEETAPMGTTESGSNTRLRAARQALGLRSQQQLAEAVTRAGAQISLRISITERTVRRWESENPPWPQPDHQAALEHLFNRPVTELGVTPPWAGEEAALQQRERAAPAGVGSAVSGALGVFPRRALADPLPGSIAADFIT